MKILFGGTHYPKFSESYMAAEIRYATSVGVDVAVWSPEPGAPGVPESVAVYRQSLDEALRRFRPDVIHAYYAFGLTWAAALAPAFRAGIPVTVRGHRFPNELEGARMLALEPGVKRIWMLPHLADLCNHPKIWPMSVGFDSTRYKPAVTKDRRLVVRTAAGKPNKGLRDFIEVAHRCPEFTFKLVVDRSGFENYLGDLERASRGRVEILYSIPDKDVTDLVTRAGIYLGTSDTRTGSPFGEPISLAEAMATGALVLARQVTHMAEYLGLGGFCYNNPEQASEWINGTLDWGAGRWAHWTVAAIHRAEAFKDTHVFPELIRSWKYISGDKNFVDPTGSEVA